MAALSSSEGRGEVRAALQEIVLEHGRQALADPGAMSNLLKDLLPDRPRIARMFVAAAEDRLADEIRAHVAEGMDASTATRLAAASFAGATMFASEACTWVAVELAIALGLLTDSAEAIPSVLVSPGNSGPRSPAGRQAGENSWHSTGAPVEVTSAADAPVQVAPSRRARATADGDTAMRPVVAAGPGDAATQPKGLIPRKYRVRFAAPYILTGPLLAVIYGVPLVAIMVFLPNSQFRANAIQSLLLWLWTAPGIALIVSAWYVTHTAIVGSGRVSVEILFPALAAIALVPCVSAIVYCIAKVSRGQQPEIAGVTRLARRLAR